MKIALYHNLPSGGAKRHTFEQVSRLAARGHEITEYTLSTADARFFPFSDYVQERRVYEMRLAPTLRRRIPFVTPYAHALSGLWTLERLKTLNATIAREIDAKGYDVVLVKDCHLSLNPSVLRYLSTPSVFQCHHGLRHRVEAQRSQQETKTLLAKVKNLYYSPAQALYESKFARDENQDILCATLILSNSKFAARLIRDSYHAKSSVLYPGIDTEKFQPLGICASDYVLSVGALIYSKGHRFVVSALSKLQASIRPKLLIAANHIDESEAQTLRAQAAESGVELAIEQIFDDRQLVEVYRRAKVFVYAPLQEALGMAPLEAMACGTPVVAVGEGGVCETVPDGVGGFLVERRVEQFAAKLHMLLADNQLRRKMGDAGAAHVRLHWSWQRAVDKLEGYLYEVAAMPKHNKKVTPR